MALSPLVRQRVLNGRLALENYRTEHARLYTEPSEIDIHQRHNPLLDKLRADLLSIGFANMEEFCDFDYQLTLEE